MKLVGRLKEEVEKAENKEQVKELIADAGMELTDEEVDQVRGGWNSAISLKVGVVFPAAREQEMVDDILPIIEGPFGDGGA